MKLLAKAEEIKAYFTLSSGGKRILVLKRAGIAVLGSLILFTALMAWFGPAEDQTYYRQSTQSQSGKEIRKKPVDESVPQTLSTLFSSGQEKMQNEKRAEIQKAQTRTQVNYYAPQVIGAKSKAPRAIKMGSKLVGFLLSTIDTRSQSLVKVRLTRGGESSGIEIEKDSVLYGQYSYSGSGDLVFISFSRLDTPDGDSRKIQAHALDSGSYTAGIRGKVFSSNGVKVAAQLGLTMFSGMADVLTEKESLGSSTNSIQARPTMKNALLQGLSRTSQDQASRTASEVGSVKDYVVIPEGKEMIIELTEDYRN